MPVIFLKYKSSLISDETMEKLVSALPTLVSGALDVPEDENKRLTPKDIQIWAMPEGKFDVNIKPLQLMIPLHEYAERAANIDARAELIATGVRKLISEHLADPIGWVWIPISNTGFSRIQ